MRLIDADKLFDYIQKEKAWKQDTQKLPRYGQGKYDAYYEMLNIINSQPTAEPRKVRGKWMLTGDEQLDTIYSGYKCSICENIICGNSGNFCYNCGADMRRC